MKGIDTAILKDDSLPEFDDFKGKLDASGNFESGYNNLWMRVMLAPDGSDEYMASQLRGRSLAEKIAAPDAKMKFLELCQAHTVAMEATGNDITKKRALLLSDDCNKKLWEIYSIGRANGLTNKELLG